MHAPSFFRLLKLEQPNEPGEGYWLPPEKLISSNPRQTAWTQYTDHTGKFFAGFWRSEPGKWKVSYTEEEYCHMLEGTSIITDCDGTSIMVTAGESFIIPAGFVGTWEVVQTTTKRFVIYQA
jgi:uncharacterized protein